ncbi:MAG: 50S ribosomal protein L17 [Phycisphaerae bacterium]|nr:50S ribosomal protein L17 [Phycisphaerae bacterium]
MRHQRHFYRLNRTAEHRLALRRNMAQSMIEHGQIRTTLVKAKNLQPYIEKIVTMAIRARKCKASGDNAGALRARRIVHSLLGERSIIPEEHREAFVEMSDASRRKAVQMASGRRYRTGEPRGRLSFTAESVSFRLIEKVAARFEDRPGGYTRLIRLSERRLGDHTQLAVLQFVGNEEAPLSLTRPERSARKRRADARYAMAARLAKSWGRETAAKTSAAGKPADASASEPQDSEGSDSPKES